MRSVLMLVPPLVVRRCAVGAYGRRSACACAVARKRSCLRSALRAPVLGNRGQGIDALPQTAVTVTAEVRAVYSGRVGVEDALGDLLIGAAEVDRGLQGDETPLGGFDADAAQQGRI